MDDALTFFSTPKGDELVVMTRARYDQLVDRAVASASRGLEQRDAEDAALANTARAEWIEAGKPVAPLAVIRRVRAGDTYLKAFRTFRGLTQKQLSQMAGIGQGYLSAIESAKKTPNEAKRLALTAALDIHPLFLTMDAPRPRRVND